MTRKRLCKVFAAGCTADGAIVRYLLSDDGKLTETGRLPLDRPMYFVRRGDRLHVLLRAPETLGGQVSGYFSCPADATVADLSGMRSTEGVCACHLSAVGEDIYAVNYVSGSLTRVGKKTVTHEAKPGMLPGRQDKPHTHMVIPTPDDKFLLCTDLGLDRIYVYDRELNPVSFCEMPAGCGVRHLIFHPDGRHLYAVNELDSTVCSLRYGEDGTLTLLSQFSCRITAEKNTAAAIRISADGTRLYVSHRGEDAVTVFAVEDGGDTLRYLHAFPCGGAGPRDIFLTPDGKYLLAANEREEGNVAVIRLDGDRYPVCDVKPLAGALCVFAEQR